MIWFCARILETWASELPLGMITSWFPRRGHVRWKSEKGAEARDPDESNQKERFHRPIYTTSAGNPPAAVRYFSFAALGGQWIRIARAKISNELKG